MRHNVFTTCNRKLHKLADYLGIPQSNIKVLNLPAGYTCHGAGECRTYAHPATGKIEQQGNVRCYAASIESRCKNVRKKVWDNFNLISGCDSSYDVATMLHSMLREFPKVQVVRLHAHGDFMTEAYTGGIVKLAQWNPDIVFYGYTKALRTIYPFMGDINRLRNLRLTYSLGGRFDRQYFNSRMSGGMFYKMRYCDIVDENNMSLIRNEWCYPALPIDVDDTHAYFGKVDFSVQIHGMQQAGSRAMDSVQALKVKGV